MLKKETNIFNKKKIVIGNYKKKLNCAKHFRHLVAAFYTLKRSNLFEKSEWTWKSKLGV